MNREYFENVVAEAIANPGVKTYVNLESEDDAANLVAAILMKPYEFTLRTRSGVECVNARSILGAIYFLSHKGNCYLTCEGEYVPF